jgi:tetratricopeptide (TPR) repeat protein
MKIASVLLLLLALLAGCTHAPPAPGGDGLFADDRFAAPSEPIAVDDVFALDAPMRQALERDIVPLVRRRGPQHALIDALYDRGQLRLEYDAAITRNASQAYAARAGNCLSLVIMTAAFAKELGLRVRYQTVYNEESWSRAGGIQFSSGHVNLSLGARLDDSVIGGDRYQPLTIDFLPAADLRGQRVGEISETTIVAMYLNNRAAEALARGSVADAYWWIRAAIVHAPQHLNAYNTLGVVHLRNGDLDRAARAFEVVLAREPDNTTALSNLERVHSRAGRDDEARRLRARLAAIEPHPPFHYFDQGVAAMQAGDYRQAKALFEKEIARKADYHEFHFWLGLAHAYLGELPQARKEIALAIESSTQGGHREIYAAKLDRLRAARRLQ